MISTALTILLVAAAVGLAGLLIAGIIYAATARQSPSGAIRLVFISVGVVLGWVLLVFALATASVFAASYDKPPTILFGVAIPIVVGLGLLAYSATMRGLLERIPVHWLIGVQIYRVLGAVFVIAYLQGLMPAEFALPAGIGDILIGLAAPVVAYRVSRGLSGAYRSAVLWNAFGLADLVLAVTLGFLTSPSAFQLLALDAPNWTVSRYPFALVPAFAVPVSVLLHAFSLWRLKDLNSPAHPRRRWLITNALFTVLLSARTGCPEPSSLGTVKAADVVDFAH